MNSPIKSVSGLNVNGARFVEIAFEGGGEMSVLRNDGDESLAQTLLRESEAQMAYSRKIAERARRMREAAAFAIRAASVAASVAALKERNKTNPALAVLRFHCSRGEPIVEVKP